MPGTWIAGRGPLASKTGRPVGLALASIGAIVCPTACASELDEATVTRIDSAGVEIVYSEAPASGFGGWTIASEPILEIASDEGATEDVLYQVRGVAVTPDGRVAVANRGDGTLRLYDDTGALLWRTGGAGEGPAEFSDLRGLVLRDPGFWVFQSLPRPIKVFDDAGAFVRSVPAVPVNGPRLEGLLADDAQIATGRGAGESSGTVWIERAPVLRFDGETVDTLAVLPLRRMVQFGGALVAEAQALGPYLQVAPATDVVYAGFPDSYDVQVLAPDGRLVRRIRRSWSPVPVTDAHAASYRGTLVDAAEGDPRLEPLYRQLADDMAFPDHHPAFDRFLVDGTGALWVRRPQTEPPWSEAVDYSPVPIHPATWDVFAPDGAWIAVVTLPARFRLTSVGAETVAGVAKDALDVERVQVWRLHRTP